MTHGFPHRRPRFFLGAEMPEKPTFASVTETSCTCGYLQRAADSPSVPIVFDKQTSEFQFTYQEAECDGPSTLVIYHCPFCGGAAPKSKRDLLFAVIPPDESKRLIQLFLSVRTATDALEQLGKPNRDDPTGTVVQSKDAPLIQLFRTMVYEDLSEVAEVWLTERPDGTLTCSLQGKFLGNRPPHELK
jgi:hypothetical protein